MERDEILVGVTIPLPAPGSRFSFQKLRIRDSIDFPLMNLAAAGSFDDDGRVTDLRMVVSGMGSYPRKIGKVEEAAVGNRLDDRVIEAVARQAFRQNRPLANIPVDRDWRREMVPVLVKRALREMAAG